MINSSLSFTWYFLNLIPVMPPGDEKGLSKEILEQRRKIAEQSKRDKAEEKARLAKNW